MKKPYHKPTFEVLEGRTLAAAVATLSAGTLTVQAGAEPVLIRQVGAMVRVGDGLGHGRQFPLADVARVVVEGNGRTYVDHHGFLRPVAVRNAYDADRPIINGEVTADFSQSLVYPNCGFAAALDAEIVAGKQPVAVTWAGIYSFAVTIGGRTVGVRFDGTRLAADPPEKTPGEAWPLLANRWYGVVVGTGPIAGTNAIKLVKGLSPYDFTSVQTVGGDPWNAVVAALAARKDVLAATHFLAQSTGGGFGYVAPQLIDSHQYAVAAAWTAAGQRWVTVVNPWAGVGGSALNDPPSGRVTLPWSVLLASTQIVTVG